MNVAPVEVDPRDELEEMPVEQSDEMMPQKEACVTIPHTLTTDQQVALYNVIALFRHASPSGILNRKRMFGRNLISRKIPTIY